MGLDSELSQSSNLIWRGAYLGSDLQLLGSWTGPNRQWCFVAGGDNSLGSESLH